MSSMSKKKKKKYIKSTANQKFKHRKKNMKNKDNKIKAPRN